MSESSRLEPYWNGEMQIDRIFAESENSALRMQTNSARNGKVRSPEPPRFVYLPLTVRCCILFTIDHKRLKFYKHTGIDRARNRRLWAIN